MTDRSIVFEEPDLEFRFGQLAKDPHDGLTLFGPFDADHPSSPALNYVALGSSDGLAALRNWTAAMSRAWTDAPDDNLRLWPPFPGFEAAFSAKWPATPTWKFEIDNRELLSLSRLSDPYQRAFDVVNLYLEGIRVARKRDEAIGVAICVVPDEVYRNCRPKSRVTDPSGEKITKRRIRSRRAGQMELFSEYDRKQYFLSRDFRRQLKARSMQYGIPVQIIRESTLKVGNDQKPGSRQVTPMSDRMWNLGTALYYKCGGKPWKLSTPREGVCYIGIAFRRTESSDSDETACCAAQMFLNTGDGVVFLGEYGPWYSARRKQFHLSASAAESLLGGVLRTYEELEGKKLNEVFLHSRSDISREEFEGYQSACPPGVRLVGIRVRKSYVKNPRLYRDGQMPVIRGTFWRVGEESGLLWGSGFAPRLATYKGWEVPVPVRIDVQHGDAAIERVAHDIFGLTKLNYNACHLGDSEPVTIGFSDAVGEILITNPNISGRKPNFKYYI